MMRTGTTALLGLLVVVCFAQVNPNNHWVDAYSTSDGVCVPGHYATDPNYTNRDNYSTYPNVNPFTGQQGTIQPDGNIEPTQSNGPGQPYTIVSYGQVSTEPSFQFPAATIAGRMQQNQWQQRSPQELEAARANRETQRRERAYQSRLRHARFEAKCKARREQREAKRRAKAAKSQ